MELKRERTYFHSLDSYKGPVDNIREQRFSMGPELGFGSDISQNKEKIDEAKLTVHSRGRRLNIFILIVSIVLFVLLLTIAITAAILWKGSEGHIINLPGPLGQVQNISDKNAASWLATPQQLITVNQEVTVPVPTIEMENNNNEDSVIVKCLDQPVITKNTKSLVIESLGVHGSNLSEFLWQNNEAVDIYLTIDSHPTILPHLEKLLEWARFSTIRLTLDGNVTLNNISCIQVKKFPSIIMENVKELIVNNLNSCFYDQWLKHLSFPKLTFINACYNDSEYAYATEIGRKWGNPNQKLVSTCKNFVPFR